MLCVYREKKPGNSFGYASCFLNGHQHPPHSNFSLALGAGFFLGPVDAVDVAQRAWTDEDETATDDDECAPCPEVSRV